MEGYKNLLTAVIENLAGGGSTLPKEEEFKIGDYVNYTPKSNSDKPCEIEDTLSGVTVKNGATGKQTFTTETETMKWKVFDYNDETITIISDIPTTQTLKLEGANGYNNGVHILNKICQECYSSADPKLTARSINIEDVRGIMQDGFNANKDLIGQSKTYTTNNRAPKIWAEFEKDLGAEAWKSVSKQSEKTYTNETAMELQGPDATFYQTFWTNEDTTNVQDGMSIKLLPWKDNAYKDIMFGANTLDMASEDANKKFWLASRFVFLSEGGCSFGLQVCIKRICGRLRHC